MCGWYICAVYIILNVFQVINIVCVWPEVFSVLFDSISTCGFNWWQTFRIELDITNCLSAWSLSLYLPLLFNTGDLWWSHGATVTEWSPGWPRLQRHGYTFGIDEVLYNKLSELLVTILGVRLFGIWGTFNTEVSLFLNNRLVIMRKKRRESKVKQTTLAYFGQLLDV